MPSDTSEKALETIIVNSLMSHGWLQGAPHDYEREFAVDLVQLTAFLEATQPKLVDALDLKNASPKRQKFLARLQGEVTRRGVIHVLRKGIEHQGHHVDLFYGTPTSGNTKAETLHARNRFNTGIRMQRTDCLPIANSCLACSYCSLLAPLAHQALFLRCKGLLPPIACIS